MNGLCYGAIQGGRKETLLFDIQEPECHLGERERERVYSVCQEHPLISRTAIIDLQDLEE